MHTSQVPRIRATACGDLLDFNEVQRRLKLGSRTDIGTHEISVEQVVGSVSRVHEFDGCFRPRTARLKKVLSEIRAARPNAADDPILVYQVDAAYFVVDGHKRMALAVDEGRQFIDAEVSSFQSQFQVARGTTLDDIRATELERQFREVTGLAEAVRDARFPLGDPDAYLELAESVKSHAYDLSRRLGRLVDLDEGARHWYDYTYRPGVGLAKESRLRWLLSSCTEPELFLVLRRGARYETTRVDWTIPDALSERAVANLQAAEPSAIPAMLASATGRSRQAATVLPPAAIKADPEPADGTSVVQRPRREREPTPD